jgi:ribosome-binding factor A
MKLMGNVANQKRAEYRKSVIAALHQILNDPSVMPNADCPDLVVNVCEVDFGKTVRTIYVDFLGFWRDPERAKTAHERYTKESQAKGLDGVYDDLTDVAALPHVREVLEKALQKKLGLTYQPTIHVIRNLRRADRPEF